ncbi:putative bifunctional diguanylate cyclase/phosphodiesterase [Leptospira sp. GIMC2001]|uniref:putative bifunctional diguanylate cyclase/phosphodiesterase n=1 Tax=Leptospira sp. GIMC2001 TaxID=1513297 RepID=UPI0023490D9C|nr:bifunctional diguanylate cyclase/phosphodiesterase [Leptospira sp. GIMC2001]WCL49038.1 bifunctional diguanylate cyclase/phosphodiesterase [Leptospira sp. GIMC2001]
MLFSNTNDTIAEFLLENSKKNIFSSEQIHAFYISYNGLCLLDSYGIIINVNRSFYDIMQINIHESIVGKSWSAVLTQCGLEFPSSMETSGFDKMQGFKTHLIHKKKSNSGTQPILLSIYFRQDGSILLVLNEISDRNFEVENFLEPAELSRSRDYQSISEKERGYLSQDILTKIPNRHQFYSFIKEELNRFSHGRDINSEIAVILIDIDRFSLINELKGIEEGNRILIEFADKLLSEMAIDPNLFCSRLEGDEFGLVIRGLLTEKSLNDRLENLIDKLRFTLEFSGSSSVYLTLSAGVSFLNRKYTIVEEVVRDAEIALMEVRKRGGNGYNIFRNEMYKRKLNNHSLENDLHFALKNQELELHFQPIYSAQQKKIISFESLIRWNHPRLGYLPPLEFIYIAESSGQILKLGEFVIDRAVQVLHNFNKNSIDCEVSVNISPIQFYNQDIRDLIQVALTKYSVSPSKLHIEITESTPFTDITSSLNKIHELSQLGIKIFLDDFGTGYSSLSLLNRFPIHALKVDRSFIVGMKEKKVIEILKIIQLLGSRMNFKVVVEGIEIQQNFKILKDIGFDLMQGFLISRPMPEKNIYKLKRMIK